MLRRYERLDELDGAAADDPRILAPANDLAAAVPDEVLAAIPGRGARR
jgi:hypothetical protein